MPGAWARGLGGREAACLSLQWPRAPDPKHGLHTPSLCPSRSRGLPTPGPLLVLPPLQGVSVLRGFTSHTTALHTGVHGDNLLILTNADGWAPPGRADFAVWTWPGLQDSSAQARQRPPLQPTSHNLSPCAKGHVCAQNIRFTILSDIISLQWNACFVWKEYSHYLKVFIVRDTAHKIQMSGIWQQIGATASSSSRLGSTTAAPSGSWVRAASVPVAPPRFSQHGSHRQASPQCIDRVKPLQP